MSKRRKESTATRWRAWEMGRAAAEGLLIRWPRLYAWLLEELGRGDANKLLFLRVIKPGAVCFDVGANIGHYSLLFVRLAGRDGQLHAFEPVPENFARLSRVLRPWAALGQVHLNNVAVGVRSGDVTILVPEGDPAQASLRTQSAGSWRSTAEARALRCECTTLDSYCESKQLKCVDLIKCDVEGGEFEVLRGAEDVLRSYAPLLHLELSRQWTTAFGYSPEVLLGHLQGLGYGQVVVVDKDSRGRLTLEPCPSSWPAAGTLDVFCVHDGPKHEAIRAFVKDLLRR